MMQWESVLRQRLTKVTVTDFTRSARKEDYDKALDKYLALIAGQKVLSVYRTGSIGSPGLSDIDLFLVLRGDVRDSRSRYSIQRLSDFDRYLFSHDCEIVDLDSFIHLDTWFPVFSLDHVAGEDIDREESYKDNPDIPLMLLVKLLILKLPAELIRYSFLQGILYERICENLVHSVVHAINLLKLSGGQVDEKDLNFIGKVGEMRSGWFMVDERERREVLKELIVRSLEIVVSLQYRAVRILRERWLMEETPQNDWGFPTNSLHIMFTSNWDGEQALESVIYEGGKVLALPMEFSVVPIGFVESGGLIGRYIRSLIDVPTVPHVITSEAREVLAAHVRTVEGLALFHSRVLRVPAHGYHTFGAPHTNSKMRFYIDKIVNRFMRFV